MTIRKRLVVYTSIDSLGIYIKLVRLSLNPEFIQKVLSFEDICVFSIESNKPAEHSFSEEDINQFLNEKSAIFSIINFSSKFGYSDFLRQKICISKDIYLYIPWWDNKTSIENIRDGINHSLEGYENVTLYTNLPKHSEKIILELDEEGGNSLLCDMLYHLSWETNRDIIDYQD